MVFQLRPPLQGKVEYPCDDICRSEHFSNTHPSLFCSSLFRIKILLLWELCHWFSLSGRYWIQLSICLHQQQDRRRDQGLKKGSYPLSKVMIFDRFDLNYSLWHSCRFLHFRKHHLLQVLSTHQAHPSPMTRKNSHVSESLRRLCEDDQHCDQHVLHHCLPTYILLLLVLHHQGFLVVDPSWQLLRYQPWSVLWSKLVSSILKGVLLHDLSRYGFFEWTANRFSDFELFCWDFYCNFTSCKTLCRGCMLGPKRLEV